MDSHSKDNTNFPRAGGNRYLTPPPTKMRLPRSLSGTKAAQERKKLLQNLRQRRKRARERAELQRRETLVTSSDEEAEDYQQGPPVDDEDVDDEDADDSVRQPQFRSLPPEDEEIIARRTTLTAQFLGNCSSLRSPSRNAPAEKAAEAEAAGGDSAGEDTAAAEAAGQDAAAAEEAGQDAAAAEGAGVGEAAVEGGQTTGETTDNGNNHTPEPSPIQDRTSAAIDKLAREFARVKCSSFVSDAAMDKLLRLFVSNHEDIMMLVNNGVIAGNYTKGIRPLLTAKILPIYSSILIKEMGEGEPRYRKIDKLKCLPAEYLDLPHNGPTSLLRIETYVRLKDVKKNYLSRHGRTRETMKNLKQCAISADGVAESKKGSRTFTVVTIRIGNCIYPIRIFNPLIGVEESKPSAKEIIK